MIKYGKTIAAFVTNYRRELSLSQSDLGRRLDVSGQYVSNVERAVIKNPLTFAVRLAEICDPERKVYLLDLIQEAAAAEAYEKVKKVRAGG